MQTTFRKLKEIISPVADLSKPQFHKNCKWDFSKINHAWEILLEFSEFIYSTEAASRIINSEYSK